LSTKNELNSYLISLPKQKAQSWHKEKSRALYYWEPVKSKFQNPPKKQIPNKFEISNHQHINSHRKNTD